MFSRGILAATAVLAICLMACGATPAEVNNSGHDPFLSGDYPAALEVYQLAQERSSELGEPFYNSGNVLYRTGEYEDSIQYFDESLKHAQGELRSSGFFNRGNALFQQQQFRQAVEAYKEVLRMNPNDEDAKHNLELALNQLPPPEEEQDQGRRGRTGTGRTAGGRRGAGPAARGTRGAGPAARGTRGAGPAARGTRGAGPAARGTRGAGPAARGTRGAGPAARGTRAR